MEQIFIDTKLIERLYTSMKTRFDETVWITAHGEVLEPNNMKTTALLAIIRMLIQRPDLTVLMMVQDIETEYVQGAWSKVRATPATKKESIRRITSMGHIDVITYSLESVLGEFMINELKSRGVDVKNYIDLIYHI